MSWVIKIRKRLRIIFRNFSVPLQQCEFLWQFLQMHCLDQTIALLVDHSSVMLEVCGIQFSPTLQYAEGESG